MPGSHRLDLVEVYWKSQCLRMRVFRLDWSIQCERVLVNNFGLLDQVYYPGRLTDGVHTGGSIDVGGLSTRSIRHGPMGVHTAGLFNLVNRPCPFFDQLNIELIEKSTNV